MNATPTLFPAPPPEPAPAPAPPRDVALEDLPERFRPLLERFERVDPACARVARIAVAEGEAGGRPYDAGFLATLVERAERRTPADPAERRPVEPRPYTAERLRACVEGSFRSTPGVWEALTAHAPEAVGTTLDLVARLRARLAAWGLHTSDVRVTTEGPDGERPPREYGEAQTVLAALACRLAKDYADRGAGRAAEDTARRLARDLDGFAEAVADAERLLAGGPLHLPREPAERVGGRGTWWAVVAGPGKPRRKPYGVKRGSRPAADVGRPGLLGPFPTERAARQAGDRATCTADDSAVGLFAQLDDDLFLPQTTH